MKMRICALSLCLVFVAASAQATTVIEVQRDNVLTAMTEGLGGWGTFGQVFTVPAENDLDSFSFLVQPASNATGPLTLRGYVAAWNGSGAEGAMLYRSDPITTTFFDVAGPGSDRFEELSFDVGGVTLDVGSQYVAFISVNEQPGGDPYHSLGIGINYYGGDTYPGGMMVGKNNLGGGLDELTSGSWSVMYGAQGVDMAGEITFVSDSTQTGAVPEPMTVIAISIGVAGLGGYIRKRRLA